MRSLHPLPLGVVAVWTCAVLLAVRYSDLSASAGRLPGSWMRIGVLVALLHAIMVIVAVCYLPERFPRLLSRLLQLVGMAGAFWSAGTLTRAVYALAG